VYGVSAVIRELDEATRARVVAAASAMWILLTDGYGTSVARPAVVLSAAPLAWAVTSLAGLTPAYAAFAVVLAAGALTATRARTPVPA
jgi:hypothetical protein